MLLARGALSSAWKCALLLSIFRVTAVQTTPVNIALNKPITAEVTCGQSGAETYYSHSQIFLRPSERTSSTCGRDSHTASAMVDEQGGKTWWQSTSRGSLIGAGYGLSDSAPQAVITVDLLKVLKYSHRPTDNNYSHSLLVGLLVDLRST